MKLIIFNLDTLVNTTACKPYLHRCTAISRLVEKIQQGQVPTWLFEQGIVVYFNMLQSEPDIQVMVVSGSPKAYCRAVLVKCGFKVKDDCIVGYDHIYGDQGTSSLSFTENTLKPLQKIYGREIKEGHCLVVGNAPKDIYFGHHINSATVFTAWQTDFDPDLIMDKIKPTGMANNLAELKGHIVAFVTGFMTYAKPDFKQGIRTIDTARTSKHHLDQSCIGFAKDYVPSINLPGNTDGLAHYTWMDINFGLKLAKGYRAERLDSGEAMPICFDDDMMHRGLPIKVLAKYYFAEFAKWVATKNIQGLVTLVPMPSSVPKECNLNSVMSQVCCWWAQWAKNTNLPCTLQVCDMLERWRPSPAAHIRYLQLNQRKFEPHLNSIGVAQNSAIADTTQAVIIIDDVLTTGTQMNAVVTVLKELSLIPAKASVYGYVWARAVLPAHKIGGQQRLP
ncbi:MAG: phosphoglycolate phosphatase-like HAD superfamily hydrolase [Phenylobacterium sp.]|jgi:phosphoglycolate phosphatase-like HAD superfamily hydrolase